MEEYDLNEVFEYADDLKRAYESKDDVEEFNQAVMRLRDVAQNLSVIDSFENVREWEG